MTILLTGSSGFIGTKLLKELCEKGEDVLALDTKKPKKRYPKYIRRDIINLKEINEVFSNHKIETVIHLVGLPDLNLCQKNPQMSFQINVVSVQNILDMMRIFDVKRIIFASSATVYGYSHPEPVSEKDSIAPDSVYGFHKYVSEQLIRAYSKSFGIEYIIFRLFNVFGGNAEVGNDVISIFLRRALKKETLLVKNPNNFRDFVHVNSLVKAFNLALQRNIINEVINIGSGLKVSLKDVSNIFKEHFPKVNILEENSEDKVSGVVSDISTAKELLGFNPENPLNMISNHIVNFLSQRNYKNDNM